MAFRLCVLALSALPAWASAGGFSVSPTTLEFRADQLAQGLRLQNSGRRHVDAQLRVFEWTQVDGQDVLTASRALVASPPMASLAPGQEQFVRIVRLDPAPAAKERSYRLLIDELPVAAAQAAGDSGLNFVVRFSVPVFVAGAGDSTGETHWSLGTDGNGAMQLHADNRSALRTQLADLRILDASGGELYRQDGLVGYVLTGQQRDWALRGTPADFRNARQIEARIDGEIQRQPLETGAR